MHRNIFATLRNADDIIIVLQYTVAQLLVFITGNHVAFELHFVTLSSTKCHQILTPYPALSVSLMPLSRPLLYISYMWVVRYNSAMMKDDICDKCTDHKLSNHSRTCLLAAPLVTLCTLSLPSCPCNSPSAQHMAAALDTLGQSSL